MKISLIHPSKGRPKKAFETYSNWIRKSSNDNIIEWILVVDKNDPTASKYKVYNNNVIIADSTNLVQATNIGALHATGELLIYLSDDFDCPYHWDKLLVNEIEKINKKEYLIKVDDGLQDFDNVVLTIPMMSMELYNKLGYFWHPDYKSIWVDVDLYYTVKKMNSLHLSKHLLFPHLHHSTGKAQHDNTYKQSENNYPQGLKVIEQRAKEGNWSRIASLKWLNFALKQKRK